MDDLISRQPILDSYNRICESCGEDKKYGGAICRSCYLDDAISIVEDAPSAQQWIPCSERLPECDYTDVLICVHDKRKGCENDFYVIQAYTVGKHWEPTLAVDMTDFDVVAWMPLPDPYKEEPTCGK